METKFIEFKYWNEMLKKKKEAFNGIILIINNHEDSSLFRETFRSP